jgi:KorB domain
MLQTIEVSSLDLRYEGCRIKDKGREKALLCSISEKGIVEPLEGIDTQQGRILLNGFKRLRCAKKLGIGIVPYVSLGNDAAMGIIQILRVSNNKSLSILEQARWIDELKGIHNMGVLEIAQKLERSKSWVSVRVGLMGEMSAYVRQRVFNGEFPVYCYMYTLRQFMRINCAKKQEVDAFVKAVAGRHLSIRAIETLAYGYFKGPEEFREQIKGGNILWGLEALKGADAVCNEQERGMLQCLEVLHKYMQRFMHRGKDTKFKSNAFYAQANLLAGGILSKMPFFKRMMEEFHDRTGRA